MAELRAVPKNPLVDELKLSGRNGPQPSDRTMQFLRVYDLTEDLAGQPERLLEKVHAIAEREPSADNVYTLAELSYIEAKRVESENPRLGANFYGASVLNAYKYLFDDRFRSNRNPYDPHFRGACDLYNAGLEASIRLLSKEKNLMPGQSHTINTAGGSWDVTCVLRGDTWQPEDFGRFEFVSDYEIKGLKNHYQSYGLGVPLIAVRRNYAGEPAVARYYPANLSFPVTAFLRWIPEDVTVNREAPSRHRGLIELYDPLAVTDIPVGSVEVPLESDLTTPLAYFLSNPAMENFDAPTMGLLRPDKLLARAQNGLRPIMGLYMVQPYQPGKIPVLLVHGLWSSPMTWMAMFNDVRSCPEIREHYQFWFYLYPTAQPFWMSAAQLRSDLAELRQTLDPQHREPALDQMVLVGHSMGGLVARLQTLQSRNDYWSLVSDKPFEQVRAEPQLRDRMANCFFFQPNPSVRRVVTIATPHQGTTLSNQTTQWLLDKMIRLPQILLQNQEALFRDNKDFFRDHSLLKIATSIDSLAPSVPIFNVMAASPRLPGVQFHNIIGVIPRRGLLGKLTTNSDGVIPYGSAHTDDATSELIVPAVHLSVHCHPLAVLEVRRILLEHLAGLRGDVRSDGMNQTASVDARRGALP